MMLKAVVLIALVSLAQTPRMDALVAALRPALPFPAAAADGELPADNSSTSKWFVVWPTVADETRIFVKANPLHPETQKAGAEAMNHINAAIVAAERRAQAAYDEALERVRRTGKGTDLDIVTLDDEGIAGERIDAELEVRIELEPAESFAMASSEAPVVEAGTGGATWILRVEPNTYRSNRGPDQREHFRAAETRLYFGPLPKPAVTREGNEPLFRVTLAPTADSFVVVIRGNAALVRQIAAGADWARLAEHRVALLRPNKREG